VKRKAKIILSTAGILFVLVFVMTCSGAYIPGIDVALYFPFAWIWFIARVVPQLHYRWDMIGSALIYALLFVAGSHLFLNWVCREVRPTTSGERANQGSAWKWRWTLSGFAIVVLMFASGIALTGIVHQVTWMSRSGEPLYRKWSAPYRIASRVKCASNLRQIGLALLMYADAEKGNFPDDLGTLLITEDLSPELFVCPMSDDTRAEAPTTQAVAAELGKTGHCSYLYFGKGRKNDMPSTEPLLVDLPPNHDGDGINVCFGDGHVEWLAEPAAGEFLLKHGFERIENSAPYAQK